jgi:hypothetical protein
MKRIASILFLLIPMVQSLDAQTKTGTGSSGLPYDEPRITRKYWQDSRPLQTAVKSPSVWALLGVNGELQALWTGPKIERKLKKDLLAVSGSGWIEDKTGWSDLTSAHAEHEGHPADLTVRYAEHGIVARFTAHPRATTGPVVMTFAIDRPRRFRYQLTIKDSLARNGVHIEHTGAFATIVADSFNTYHVGAHPAPESLTFKDSVLTIVIPATDTVTITIDAEKKLPAIAAGMTLVKAWERAVKAFTATATPAHYSRVTVKTGIVELDQMFATSIDAIDNDRFPSGVIIAGPDNPFYRGSWLRDGTYSIIGYELATAPHEAEDFYRFWITEGGFSEYGEAEAQQPAIGILGLWFHSRRLAHPHDFLQSVYPYITRWADYYVRRLDREILLNVYEEWITQILSWASWPNAEVYAGLEASSRMAAVLDHPEDARRWGDAAAKLRENFGGICYDEQLQRFIPRAGLPNTFRETAPGKYAALRDERVDAGMLNVCRLEAFGTNLGVVRVDDPRFAATEAWIKRVLFHPDHTVSRFDGAPPPDFPKGNWPTWPIISSWGAQVEFLKGRTDEAWRYLIDGQAKMHGYNAKTMLYQLPEQWNIDGTMAGTTRMLTWSHGEFLTTTLLLLTGLNTDVPDVDASLQPSLPPDCNAAEVANFYHRGYRLTMDIRRNGDGLEVGLKAVRVDADAPPELRLKIGQKIVAVGEGKDEHVQVLARGRSAFTSHLIERAEVVQKVLLGTPLGSEWRTAPPAALERHIADVESTFVREKLPGERTKRFEELLK